jgi:alpha-beta hydrolase superfamily lysophospholipase
MKNIKTNIAVITTPRRFLLRALFFGNKKAKNIFIYIHGLGSSLFSHSDFLESLVDNRTSVLTFNNRGNGIINRVRKINTKEAAGYKSVTIGMAHEVFADCVDDIDGAVRWARAAGAKNIYLVGHSTGCQKSIYYLSKRPQSPVKGVVLLAPMSDYADTYAKTDKKIYGRALARAKKMVKEGSQHDLLPRSVWPEIVDAQRWLSLYTPDSQEEIFSYASGRRPVALLKNKKPVLVVLAEADEFSDRPAPAIADWFQSALSGRDSQVKIIKGAPHSFLGSFKAVKSIMKNWVSVSRF